MSNRLMMVIAVVTGLIATALAFLYIQSATSAVERENREDSVKVLFLAGDLPANHLIDPEKDVLERSIGVVTNAGVARNAVKAFERDTLRGQRLNRPLFAGAPLLYSDLAKVLTLEIGPGNRAVSIPVDAASTFGGMLVPNDRVDIVVSYKIPPPDATRPLTGVDPNNPTSAINAMLGRVIAQTSLPTEWQAEVVLQNVRVAAIGDRLSASRQQFSFAQEQFGGAGSNIITLDVSPDDAIKLIEARAGGGNPITLLLLPSREALRAAEAASASGRPAGDDADGE